MISTVGKLSIQALYTMQHAASSTLSQVSSKTSRCSATCFRQLRAALHRHVKKQPVGSSAAASDMSGSISERADENLKLVRQLRLLKFCRV